MIALSFIENNCNLKSEHVLGRIYTFRWLEIFALNLLNWILLDWPSTERILGQVSIEMFLASNPFYRSDFRRIRASPEMCQTSKIDPEKADLGIDPAVAHSSDHFPSFKKDWWTRFQVRFYFLMQQFLKFSLYFHSFLAFFIELND